MEVRVLEEAGLVGVRRDNQGKPLLGKVLMGVGVDRLQEARLGAVPREVRVHLELGEIQFQWLTEALVEGAGQGLAGREEVEAPATPRAPTSPTHRAIEREMAMCRL